MLNQCIDKLKVVEANRLALVSHLRDALNEQVTFGLFFLSKAILIYFYL